MIDIKPLSEYSHLNKPKRFMRYVLIWCADGSASVVVDDKELTLKSGQVITITSGQIHYFKEKTVAEGFVLEFTLDFFCKDDKDIELIFHNGLFCHFDLNEVIEIANNQVISQQLHLIKEELTQQPYQYLTSIHSRIELVLVEINRAKVSRGDEIYKPDALFLKFLELVRHSFKDNFPLNHFADKLGTTETKLNELSRLHAGKSAQNVIYGLIISEAKRLLIYQSLTIKEVAFELGFNDPFYFSNFFKKHTQLSPKKYKSNLIV